jgi:antitoxin ChpS
MRRWKARSYSSQIPDRILNAGHLLSLGRPTLRLYGGQVLSILKGCVILTYNLYFGGIMHTTNLRKVGGSIMLAVPPALLDVLSLRPGVKVGIAIERGRLVVEPRRKPHYTLEELLAQCSPKAVRTREEREWLSGRPVGDELV